MWVLRCFNVFQWVDLNAVRVGRSNQTNMKCFSLWLLLLYLACRGTWVSALRCLCSEVICLTRGFPYLGVGPSVAEGKTDFSFVFISHSAVLFVYCWETDRKFVVWLTRRTVKRNFRCGQTASMFAFTGFRIVSLWKTPRRWIQVI